MGYFPASGWRETKDGGITGGRTGGYSWSSSSVGMVDSGAAYLAGESDKVMPFKLLYRSYGLPVRCVQELAVILYRSIIKARSTVE